MKRRGESNAPNADSNGQRAGFDTQKLRDALRAVLPTYVDMADVGHEILTETIEHIVQEAVHAGVSLPYLSSTGTTTATPTTGAVDLSLSELESHSLYAVLFPALTEMLFVDDPETRISLVTGDTIDEYLSAVKAEREAKERTQEGRKRNPGFGECEMCERMMGLTEHHLIPRSTHALLSKRGTYTLDEMRSRLALLCRQCHNAVHQQLTAEECALEYNTVDKLLEHEGIRKWAEYAAKQKERDPKHGGMRLKHRR